MEDLGHIVYSKEVIEFTAVANEYCSFLGTSSEYTGEQILLFMQRLLPLLYSKSLSLPRVEPMMEESHEKSVTEEEWQAIDERIVVKLGEADDFPEVFDNRVSESELPVIGSIAENLADIFQDLKDYLVVYSMGTTDLMNDALWECKENFRLSWGQKLLSALRAVHKALQNPELIGKGENYKQIDQEERDTSGWIISKRMSDFNKGENDEL
ncbi:MAG: DUF5063 domain-containing protein [Bacteroidales bacterium]|nr:DUF5063 domain-containing protein [Bacteroidales bacterium]